MHVILYLLYVVCNLYRYMYNMKKGKKEHMLMFSLYLINVWVDHYYIHRVTIIYIGSTIGETSEHSPLLLSSKLTFLNPTHVIG